jgi:hypothetical protein
MNIGIQSKNGPDPPSQLCTVYWMPNIRVVNSHHINADLDPAFHLNGDADPDPAVNFNVDPGPDPAVYFNADPDPAPHQSVGNLRLVVYRPFRALF